MAKLEHYHAECNGRYYELDGADYIIVSVAKEENEEEVFSEGVSLYTACECVNAVSVDYMVDNIRSLISYMEDL